MADPATPRNREAEHRAAELMRAAVFAWYGEACSCCGATEQLGIDHVDGDGPAQRAAAWGHPGRAGYNPARLYRWLIENGFPEGFQTHCRPCNSSKGDGRACRLDHADRPGQRRRGNAAAQAAWRTRNPGRRAVSLRPGTAGGRIVAYLDEHGPSQLADITADLALASAAVTLSALLKSGHVARPAHGVYCRPGQRYEPPPTWPGLRQLYRISIIGVSGEDL